MKSPQKFAGTADSLIRSRLAGLPAFKEFQAGSIGRAELQSALAAERPEDWGLNEDQLNLATRLCVDDESAVDRMLVRLHSEGLLPGTGYDKDRFERFRDRMDAEFDHGGHLTYIFPEEARLLFAVAEITAPARTVFIGSYYGYWAAWALPGIAAAGGTAVLIDPDADVLQLSADNLRRLGYSDVCTFACEDAAARLERELAEYDLVVLDAEGPAAHGPANRRGKAVYGPLTAAVTPWLRPGGLLLAHNVLLENLTDNGYFAGRIARNVEQFTGFSRIVERYYDRALDLPTSEGVGAYRRGGGDTR
ncbi:class I SAM-dependent methyltransferase [Streptomyces sp. NPDC049597]|uniref:O-methyltransferase n=1 Tax=Streptomyces sp. NPDC049597 TaxID=3155276 RepID=UPI0034209E08